MNLFKDTCFIKSVYRSSELEETIAEVAFIGRSNVGKSTAINKICGQKDLARVSQTPGSTRSINVYSVVKNKWIVDLPGYGFASGPKESWAKLEKMFKDYLLSRPTLKKVLLFVDGFVGATKLDEHMTMWLDRNSLPFLIIANKCDRIGASKQKSTRTKVANKLGRRAEDIRWVSAEQGLGMIALNNEIGDLLELSNKNKFIEQEETESFFAPKYEPKK